MNLVKNRNVTRVAFFGSFFGNAKNERPRGSELPEKNTKPLTSPSPREFLPQSTNLSAS
jgi:hypothetical protein